MTEPRVSADTRSVFVWKKQVFRCKILLIHDGHIVNRQMINRQMINRQMINRQMINRQMINRQMIIRQIINRHMIEIRTSTSQRSEAESGIFSETT